ncbi:hypothetical protein GJV85_09625 [Sulfurimonas aquatica]|uniref:Uncharacterized protein n=1 Tax=Sulfurimonas aquatica TaxID=2672570 RepID=A0A975GDH0_9BACT|nr:hypothetical protein [Sulfurimonas aquatica]QSZ42353.1 hypothetical protein GJV85_09625 [Sulfurimonas aquatica]
MSKTSHSNLTVKELIKKLSDLPQDVPLVTDGYEDGLDAIINVELIGIEKNSSDKWWDGFYVNKENNEKNAVYLLSTRGSKS